MQVCVCFLSDVVFLLDRIFSVTERSVNKTELEIYISLTSNFRSKLRHILLPVSLFQHSFRLVMFNAIWYTQLVATHFLNSAFWILYRVIVEKRTHKRSKHKISYSHFGRNGLALPLTEAEAITCAFTPLKRTWSTVRNNNYKRRW